MENVAKIVRERLTATSITGNHPDADLLTAFSERLLPDRERSQVLEHLALCAECRDVLALAQPGELPTAVVVQPMRGGWLTWPQLRWSLAAVGLIVVGSFVVLQHQRPRDVASAPVQSSETVRSTDEAKNQLPATEAVPGPVRAPKTADAASAKSADNALRLQAPAEAKKAFDDVDAFAKTQTPGKMAGITGGTTTFRTQALPHGPMPPAQWRQNTNARANANHQQSVSQSQAPPPPAAAPSANEQATNGLLVSRQDSPAPKTAPRATEPLEADKQRQITNAVALNARTAPPSSLDRGAGAEVARAKDAEPQTNAPKSQPVEAYGALVASTSNFSPSGSLVPESARWAINSAGGLQRSLDQGRTWQDVDVNNGADNSAGVNLQMAMKSSRARVAAKEKSDQKIKPIVFRAVAANGPDVWAGGSEGTLYHSTDAGDHWVRILPSWRGIELSGDILSLQFADVQHGRIVTSTAEIWTTADAGQTWDKQ